MRNVNIYGPEAFQCPPLARTYPGDEIGRTGDARKRVGRFGSAAAEELATTGSGGVNISFSFRAKPLAITLYLTYN